MSVDSLAIVVAPSRDGVPSGSSRGVAPSVVRHLVCLLKLLVLESMYCYLTSDRSCLCPSEI